MRTPLVMPLFALALSLAGLPGCSRSPEEPTSEFKPAQGTPLPVAHVAQVLDASLRGRPASALLNG